MGWLDKNEKDQKSKAKETTSRQSIPAREDKTSSTGTILGPGLLIKGELHADEDVWIAGKVHGEVHCPRKLTVAASGRIDGAVNCGSIVVFGEVKGNVEASTEIVIEASGKLIGDITTRLFTNHPGGFFEGYSHMVSETAPEKATVKTFQSKKAAGKE